MLIAWLSLPRSLPGVGAKEFSSKGLAVSRGRLEWICHWEIFRDELLCSSRVCSFRRPLISRLIFRLSGFRHES